MGRLCEGTRLVSPLRGHRRDRTPDPGWRGILGLRNANSVAAADGCARDPGCEAAACSFLVAGFLQAGYLPDGHAKCRAVYKLAVRSTGAASAQGILCRLSFARRDLLPISSRLGRNPLVLRAGRLESFIPLRPEDRCSEKPGDPGPVGCPQYRRRRREITARLFSGERTREG